MASGKSVSRNERGKIFKVTMEMIMIINFGSATNELVLALEAIPPIKSNDSFTHTHFQKNNQSRLK